jgi:hypothetical protein
MPLAAPAMEGAATRRPAEDSMASQNTILRIGMMILPLGRFVVRHTDDEREWSYGRESSIGRLDQLLEEVTKSWAVVDMNSEWKVVYPPAKSS